MTPGVASVGRRPGLPHDEQLCRDPAVGAGPGRAAGAARGLPPLDRRGNYVSRGEPGQAKRLRRELQAGAAKLLPGEAVSRCGKHAGMICEAGGNRAVEVKKGKYGVYFSNVVTCGSVWQCPVCAEKVARARRDQLRVVVADHQAKYGMVGMLTLTQGHDRWDALEPLLRSIQGRWRKMKGGKRWGAEAEACGLVGGYTAREVTHGANGWHPHLHVLVFFKPGCTADQAVRWLHWATQRWVDLTHADGMDCEAQAQNFRIASTAEAAADYVTKFGVEWEMTHAHLKRAKSGGRTPWQILADYVETDSDRDAVLFREYAFAFKGAKQLTPFGEMRRRHAELREAAQETLAKDETEARTICALSADTYEELARRGAVHRLIDAAESVSSNELLAVQAFLANERLGGLWPPDKAQRVKPFVNTRRKQRKETSCSR